MKKGLKRFISAAIIAATVLSFTACGTETVKKDSISKIPDSETAGIVDYTKRRKVVPESGKNLIENGASDYKIVVPATADGNVASASRELSEFLFQASGVRLPIVTDENLGYDENAKLISLGNTSVFAESGLAVPAEVGRTGYILKRKGNLVIINARESFGVVDGVYDMLSYTVDYEAYASDEIYVATKTTVPLLDFDEAFKPTVDVRTHNLKEIREDSIYRQRMKLQDATASWIAKAHTTIDSYLPLDKYEKSHSEWYGTTGGKQICFGSGLTENGDVYGMRAELVKNMESLIVSNKTGTNIQIGIQDNWIQCECDYCVKGKEKYGNYAGLQLEFTNQVAEIIDEWLAENYPERKLNYSFFAYQQCQDAPVKYDETAGKYVPASQYFRVRENVSVFFCPISTDFSKPLTPEYNSANYALLKQWSDLFLGAGRSENIMVWSYSLPAYAFFAPLDSFGSIGEIYRTYAEYGVYDVYDQGSGDSNRASFQALKTYTQTKMMYDSSYEYGELVEDFIEHYYGAGAEKITEYYNFIRAYYSRLESEGRLTGYIFFKYYDPSIWTSPVLDKITELLNGALEAIEPLKSSDPERFEVLNARIRRERLFPIFLRFEYYMGELTQAEKEEYYNDMATYTKKFGIMGSYEGAYNIDSLLEKWSGSIFA